MRAILHVTDIHFGKVQEGIVAALHADIDRARPDLCIVSGDLTMRSRRREWLLAREFLDALPVPYLVIPGNHDMPYVNLFERFTTPYARFQRYIRQELNPTFRDDEIAVIGLNTARPWVPHYTWKEGDISTAQVRMVDRFFRPVPPEIYKIVFTHHPFLPPPGRPKTYLVRHARRALQVFEKLGVDLLLGGHLHLRYTGDVTGHHTMIKRSILCAQASTTTSSRLRGTIPNGYNVIAIDGGRVDIHSWDWTGRKYELHETHRFTRVEHGWIPHEERAPAREE